MNATTQTLLDHHRDQLRASGLTDATIAAAGFYSVTDADKMARLLNVKKLPKGLNPSALAIPFTDADGRNGYCRLRPDRARINASTKKPIKYESPREQPNELYIPPGVADHLQSPSQEIAITEGEKKALACNQAGLPCLGLVGVYGWKAKGKETLLPALEHIEWKGRTVYIIVDSDGADKEDVREGMARGGSLIKHRGGNVKLLILPAGTDGAKVGLDDYLLANGLGELRKLIEAAEPIDDAGAEHRPAAKMADPAEEAKGFLQTGLIDGVPLLRFHRGAFHFWSKGRYVELQTSEARARIIGHLNAKFAGVTMKVTSDVVDQVKAQAHLSFGHEPPCWIGPGCDWKPAEMLVCRNGILHLPTLDMRTATPRFFTPVALDFDFNEKAAKPERWIEFLERDLWPNDRESISTLQEWFGYCLTADTRLQKILCLIGPKRSGKGTIARILRGIVGYGNVAGPTLASLATNFGLWPLLGKSLAIFSDARLSGRTDQSVVTERLLSISGEDALTIDRKNMEPVTAKLLTRLMLLSNELPRLTDSSGALAGRMILLRLTQSFYGKEDSDLSERLMEEREGILLWSIGGWQRLQERKRFVTPQSSNDLREQMEDLSSPIGMFVRERCNLGAGEDVAVEHLYSAWQAWCKDKGWRDSTTAQTFGRDLSAAFPQLSRSRPRDDDGGRYRAYEGIGLKPGF